MFSEVLKHPAFLDIMRKFLKILSENRGSIIVESAMIIPMIILISVSVIYLMMRFYTMAVDETVSDSVIFEKGFDEGKNIRWAAAIGDLFDEKE